MKRIFYILITMIPSGILGAFLGYLYPIFAYEENIEQKTRDASYCSGLAIVAMLTIPICGFVGVACGTCIGIYLGSLSENKKFCLRMLPASILTGIIGALLGLIIPFGETSSMTYLFGRPIAILCFTSIGIAIGLHVCQKNKENS